MTIRELLGGPVTRLRYTYRYSTYLTLHKENVAEHSYYVALYAYLVATWLKSECQCHCDRDEVVRRALFHDIDECVTGDFTRPFKYSSPGLALEIHRAAENLTAEICNDLLPDSKSASAECLNLWRSAKDDTIEGRVVAFADFLSVVSHMWNELNSANRSLLVCYDTMYAYSRSFMSSEYEFLGRLVPEVCELVDEIFRKVGQ